MKGSGFFRELRRRHVFRVAIAYALTAWLLLQLAAIVLPTFGAPHWVLKVVIGVFVLCFPLALLLAWAFEITPEGVRRTVPAGSEEARPAEHGRRVERVLNAMIIVVLASAVGVLAWRLSIATRATHAGAFHAGEIASVSPATTAAPTTAIPAKSIAVLPFVNDSGDPNQRYFSDGLSEGLIIALNQYPGLRVIARESSFQLRDTKLDSAQIGAKLHVANLLEGSVSREGDKVRVRAELVDAADGSTRWSDFYDRPYKNLFALQDDITKAVATALKAKLMTSAEPGAVVQTDRPPSGSLAAYNAYLEGNFYVNHFTETDFRKAIAAYRKAIAADPKYAAAYAQLSYASAQLGAEFISGSAATQAYAQARSAVDTALKFDPDLAAAYVARGFLLLFTLNWSSAEAAFRHALTLDPASPDAMRLCAFSLASLGRLDEAIPLGREAIKTNPLDARAYEDLARYLMGAGELKVAAQAIERAISLEPAAAVYHARLAAIEILRADPQAALQAAQAETDPPFRVWALALAYQAAGEKAAADQALHELIAQDAELAAYQIAEVYAYRGNRDQAFDWLDRAWRQRDAGIASLLYDPFLLRYKNDPRFAAFCRKVGLPMPNEINQRSSPNAGTRKS